MIESRIRKGYIGQYTQTSPYGYVYENLQALFAASDLHTHGRALLFDDVPHEGRKIAPVSNAPENAQGAEMRP